MLENTDFSMNMFSPVEVFRWVRFALEEFTAENAEIAEKTLFDKINMI